MESKTPGLTIIQNFHTFIRFLAATLAQLVEQLTRNEQVVGPSPTGGSFLFRESFLAVRKHPFNHPWIPSGIVAIGFAVHGMAGDNGRSGFAFLRNDIGARPSAMAGAFTAMDRDLHCLFYNPAGLAGFPVRRVSFTYVDHVLDFQAGVAGYAQRLTRSIRFGVGVIYMNYGTFTWRDILGEETGSSAPSDWAVIAAVADSLPFGLKAGISAKYIRSTIAEYWADAAAVHIGLLYTVASQDLNVGIALADLGKSMHAYSGQRESLPTSVRFGISKRLAHLPLLFDWDMIRFLPDRKAWYWALGGEFTLNEYVLLRLGYHSRGREERDVAGTNRFAGLSFGLGIHLRTLAVDGGVNQLGMIGKIWQFGISKTF